MYISLNHLQKIVYEYLNFIPKLKNYIQIKELNKIELLNSFLNSISWENMQLEIAEKIELEGQSFIYWYIENDKIKLKILKTENMIDIIFDENQEITDYVYEDIVTKETVDNFGNIMTTQRTVKWIFRKGYVVINDPDKGEPYIVRNKIEYKDYFPLYHIYAYKKQADKFAEIPALRYIDNCILLDKIDTNWDLINTLSGFPRVFLNNCMLVKDMSTGSAGGVITVKPIDDRVNSSVTQLEITNGLDSLQEQREIIMKDLYKKANLILENLEEKIGSSDSSRIVAQLRLPLELKIKRVLNATNSFMEFVFNIVLLENGFDNTEKVRFELPEPVIETSVYDKLLVDTQKMALGLTTMKQLLIDRGFNEEQINDIFKQINKEVVDGKTDVSINNIDNNFLRNTNIEM